MSLFNKANATSAIKPAFNVGALLDIPTGTFVKGIHGNWILNGGYSAINSFTGPGNSFKTEILLFCIITTMKRYDPVRMALYDTENSMTYERINKTAKNIMDHVEHLGLYYDEPRSILTQAADIMGDEYWELLKNDLAEFTKVQSKKKLICPMYDYREKGPVRVITPTLGGIDSLSMFDVTSVQEKIIDKANIGASDANMLFMRQGAAKTQLIMQLPRVCSQNSLYMGMVAHIGTRIDMDPYAPKPPELTFSKNGTTKKGVPEKFDFINSNLWEIYNAKPMLKDKRPEFPLDDADREESTDLFMVNMISSRNKNGPSGVQYGMIVSQANGIQPTLTEYCYLKARGKFGIIGNDRTFQLALRPDVNLQRTTLRRKIATDPRLCRAMQITSEMRQMREYWRNLDPELHVTPEVLYEDIKALGYDWDVLLNTRGYWTFEDCKDKHPRELSTMDLLYMRKGEYHPYWMNDKKEIKSQFLKLPDYEVPNK